MEKICVAVRLRPSVSQDSIRGTYWKIDDNRISLHRAHDTPISGNSFAFGTFTIHFSSTISHISLAYIFVKLLKFLLVIAHIFLYLMLSNAVELLFWTLDHVLDESCTNGSVYELVVKDIIHAAVEGFNGMLLSFFVHRFIC